MRIEHIHIDGFGRLSGYDTGSDALGSLVVVLGPNEAGKSTLFSFLTTALYGFQPASRELSPFVPWGTDEAGGSIRVRLADGGCATVSRRLRSSPAGKVESGESSRDLRNHPVPWVEHVPRTVFRQVFAITLAELAGLDEDTWGRIQDRVLGSMGASDLRSAREVADALEKEAGEIWRPNRRGNQRLRDLQEAVRALRSRRKEALDRDREIRDLVEERENVRLRLADARQDRMRDKLAVDQVQDLLPVKRQLERITELRREGGPRDRLAGLPPDLASRRQELASRHRRLEAELEEMDARVKEPEAIIARFDDEARALLGHRDAVSAFVAEAKRAGSDAEGRHERSVELDELATRRRTTAEQLLERSDDLEAVGSVSVDLLRDRIERYEAAVSAASAPADGGSAGGAVDASGLASGLAPALALIGVGAALLAWGLGAGLTLATAAGAACLAVGLTLAAAIQRKPTDAPDSARAATRDAGEEIHGEIRAMLSDLPVRSAYLDPPSPALASELQRLQELVRKERELTTAEEAHRARMEKLDGEADRIRTLLDRPGDVPALELGLALEREVAEAERARTAAESAERERSRILRTREDVAAELARVEEELADLDRRVRRAADSDTDVDPLPLVLRRVQERLEAHARGDRLEEELERAHPDLADRKARIREADERGTSWSVDEEDLARRKRRIEELDETIEELVQKGGTLERDAAHLREKETVDAVDGEIESLREEERRLTRERDRKWLLATLVRQADRRFREEHQPDLLRRASAYLARLTAGRYDRLLVDEENDGDLFHLVGPDLPAPVPLARPISTGTLEQAYLGLRLAIVDHLDHGDERLPLFMDEALVNWDADRRERGLEVLAEVSRSRQVFAFTCHPEMADDLGRRGACVLRLRR